MKVKPIYHNGFVNFLHTPESDEEYAAMVEIALQLKRNKEMQELIEELERVMNNATNL